MAEKCLHRARLDDFGRREFEVAMAPALAPEHVFRVREASALWQAEFDATFGKYKHADCVGVSGAESVPDDLGRGIELLETARHHPE